MNWKCVEDKFMSEFATIMYIYLYMYIPKVFSTIMALIGFLSSNYFDNILGTGDCARAIYMLSEKALRPKTGENKKNIS